MEIPNCNTDRRFLWRAGVFSPARWLSQSGEKGPGDYRLTLVPWPRRIYKENDGILQPAPTESCVFNVIVREEHNRAVEPSNARLDFYSGREKVQSLNLSRRALDAIRAVSISTRGPDREEELFDLRHYFSLPVSF